MEPGAGPAHQIYTGHDASRRHIDKVRERGETWTVDSELAETCRHIDEAGESLRGEIRSIGELMSIWIERIYRRIDEQAARSYRIDGWLMTLEARVSTLEDDRSPRRRRCQR
jgi:hypothetical protein